MPGMALHADLCYAGVHCCWLCSVMYSQCALCLQTCRLCAEGSNISKPHLELAHKPNRRPAGLPRLAALVAAGRVRVCAVLQVQRV